MPNWNSVLNEINAAKIEIASTSALDLVRRKYIKRLSDYSKRNVIAYYSAWLQRGPNTPNLSINDSDKNAFMATVHGMDRNLGLDLIIHTPGGSIAAAESIVDYLRRMFGTDVRAIVPQLAMSAGTMISCACKEIVMGKQSNIGPIDPQMNGMPANGVLLEFERAAKEVRSDPSRIAVWQPIIGKYHPSFLQECSNAIAWSKSVVTEWLESGMFGGDPKAKAKAKKIVRELSNYSGMKNHGRHVHIDQCKKLGLKVTDLEADQQFQDLVLTVHHAFMQTLGEAAHVTKIVENHDGIALVSSHASPATRNGG
ncbi:MAG: ATP-dependent Clp protease proteolytic subunit [Rubrivivax sp.]|nr:ATP-dependent Clp protease proteolytic subunit [Rubrivivax sp.]MCZ2088508.1 ATP-dependent Clp protease proteolytic subunit [Burkholderiales bacterium]TXI20130.1 MAG: S49 family peptidase [Ottowia sp.]HQO52613.1 ATP-dependent Clp protease proteolytic subunit [Ottowia sp.]